MALPTMSDLLNMGIHEASVDWTWFGHFWWWATNAIAVTGLASVRTTS